LSPGQKTDKSVPAAHEQVFALLRKRTGLVFPEARLAEICQIISQSAQAANLTVTDYGGRLIADRAAFDDLCNKVTTAETYFFREPRQFDFVKSLVIPSWKNENPEPTPGDAPPMHRKVWSAGCSTGEEAYSLAILFAQEGIADKVRIIGTDLSLSALARAQRADYSPWSLRTSDQEFCRRHFQQQEGRFKLPGEYTSKVRFAHGNLLDDISFYRNLDLVDLDLIFCRNVLIYLEPPAVNRVLTTFLDLLKPGGHLVLGPSDPAPGQIKGYETILCDFGVFFARRHGDISASNSTTKKAAASSLDAHHLQSKPGQPSAKAEAQQKQAVLPRRHQTQINKLPPQKETSSEATLAQAQSAYNLGLYERAFNLTGSVLDNPQAAILHIRALANYRGSAAAEKVLKKLLKQHVGNFQLQYLHGHLLMDLGDCHAAVEALKRCLFLDCKATMAHFSLALAQKRIADKTGAQRSFRNVIELCKNQEPDDILPYGDGERVRILAGQAAAELEALTRMS
jgi:chemotaxis protein methyltransferase CheR